MTEIEAAIGRPPPDELRALVNWIEEYAAAIGGSETLFGMYDAEEEAAESQARCDLADVDHPALRSSRLSFLGGMSAQDRCALLRRRTGVAVIPDRPPVPNTFNNSLQLLLGIPRRSRGVLGLEFWVLSFE